MMGHLDGGLKNRVLLLAFESSGFASAFPPLRAGTHSTLLPTVCNLRSHTKPVGALKTRTKDDVYEKV